MTTTINQIVKEVLDEMEGQTISDHKQYRDILEGKLTSRLNHLISGLKEEARHECDFTPPLNIPDGFIRATCKVCGKSKK